MSILGLIFNMIGIVILGFQPQVTLWDTGIRPKIIWLNILGWGLMFVGFGLMLISELLQKREDINPMKINLKKIIAREGLVILCWVGMTMLFGFLVGIPLDTFVIKNENLSIASLIFGISFLAILFIGSSALLFGRSRH